MQLSFSPVVSLVAALLASGCRSGEELEKNLVYKETFHYICNYALAPYFANSTQS